MVGIVVVVVATVVVAVVIGVVVVAVTPCFFVPEAEFSLCPYVRKRFIREQT